MRCLFRSLILGLCLLTLGVGTVLAAEAPDKRVALVIGNSNYTNAPVLKNPVNDASDMAKALKKLGFEVIEVENANKQKMDRAIVNFGAKLSHGGTGLFFYSGHGLQVNGRNYLVPIDAELATEGALRVETTDVDLVMDQMQVAQTRVNLIILDACRSNPFERRFRSMSRGLAPVDDAPEGTLIAYSTSPGKVASDGSGANGLYTAELLKAVSTPGLKAEDVFKTVRIAVSKDSNGAQTPWEASSLTGDFYFKPGTAPVQTQAVQPAPQADAELLFWTSIKDSKDVADFQAYLKRYPKGQFADLANNRLAALQPPKPAPQEKVAVVTPPKPLPQDQNVSAEEAYKRAFAAEKAKNYAEEVRWLRLAAAQGNAYGQAGLGMMYKDGKGVPQDYAEALKWLRLAAAQGNAVGQENLGVMYQFGWGATKNDVEAVRWYRLAAAQGSAMGQVNIGTMYEKGVGVPKDDTEAVRWYSLAAKQGNAIGQVYLGGMYQFGRGVSQDDAEAVRWYRLAAEQGNAKGQTSLGAMYKDGKGVPQNYAEAVRLYRLSAAQGDDRGQVYLGNAYGSGMGVPQDYAEALKWFRLAAAQGSPDAQNNLGLMYEKGLGVPQDISQANAWYRKSAAQGNAGAQASLKRLGATP